MNASNRRHFLTTAAIFSSGVGIFGALHEARALSFKRDTLDPNAPPVGGACGSDQEHASLLKKLQRQLEKSSGETGQTIVISQICPSCGCKVSASRVVA